MIATARDLTTQMLDTERRKRERASVALDTLMCDRENRTFGVQILNLSNGGLMAIAETDLCERDPVRIDLPTIGWIRATVVWVLGDRIGVQFRDPIDPDELAVFCKLFG
jgi:PilZ domain